MTANDAGLMRRPMTSSPGSRRAAGSDGPIPGRLAAYVFLIVLDDHLHRADAHARS